MSIVDDEVLPQRAATDAAWQVSPNQPRALRGILSLHDFEHAARRVLPRSVFGYVVGGVEDEFSMRANRAAFNEWSLRPRILIDVSRRSTATELFGRTYAAPFGIAPMGGAALIGFRADLAIAAAAAEKNIPYALSGASLVAMERVSAVNRAAWFQAYLPPNRRDVPPFLERIAKAGYETLVVTADVPVPGNRENNMRTGFTSPLRPSLRLALDGITHPRWSLGTALRTLVRQGMPHFENYGPARGAPLFSSTATIDTLRDALCWKDLEEVRAKWKGRLVIKGVLAREDVRIARETGADGIVVSNHGGRQLDGVVTSLQVLPELASEAGTMAVLFDGGVRRGSDVIKALGLGAHFVFVGRPFLYAAAVAGQTGVGHAIDLLRKEVERNLAMLGCMDCSALKSCVVRTGAVETAPIA
jgi:L-lactate dehydrogenase (cytochrome)